MHITWRNDEVQCQDLRLPFVDKYNATSRVSLSSPFSLQAESFNTVSRDTVLLAAPVLVVNSANVLFGLRSRAVKVHTNPPFFFSSPSFSMGGKRIGQNRRAALLAGTEKAETPKEINWLAGRQASQQTGGELPSTATQIEHDAYHADLRRAASTHRLDEPRTFRAHGNMVDSSYGRRQGDGEYEVSRGRPYEYDERLPERSERPRGPSARNDRYTANREYSDYQRSAYPRPRDHGYDHDYYRRRPEQYTGPRGHSGRSDRPYDRSDNFPYGGYERDAYLRRSMREDKGSYLRRIEESRDRDRERSPSPPAYKSNVEKLKASIVSKDARPSDSPLEERQPVPDEVNQQAKATPRSGLPLPTG